MCEYISFVCTTDGPLSIYVDTTLSSHGDCRRNWNLKGGAEAEWTGENHCSLTVRFEDPLVAQTIRQMLVDKFPNRTALLASITEARDKNGKKVCLHNGKRLFTEDDAGTNFEELNDLIEKLPSLPYFNPTEECTEEILEQLVAQHLFELGTYCKDSSQLDGVTLKVISDSAARDAAWDATWAAARDAAWDAARDAARAAARDAARDAALDAAHLVSGIGHSPWAPLVEIWALGAYPIGIVDGEFLVYVANGAR